MNLEGRYIILNKKISFSINDFSVDENPSSHFAILDMKIVSSGMNLHELPIKPQAIEKASTSLFGKPVLAHYIEDKDALGGHDPEQIPIGCFLDKDVFIFTDEQQKMWLSAKAYVWKKYFPEVVNVFRKNDGKTNISMEIEVLESEIEMDGYEWINDFSFLGVTAIGVQPAIVGSGGQVLEFSKMVDEAKKEFASKYDELDFTIPEDVKKASSNGLELKKKFNRGGTSVGLAMAKYINKNKTTTPEKIKSMAKYFARTPDDNIEDKESSEWISYQLWGGSAGRRWSVSMDKKIKELDEKHLTSFSNDENGTGEALKVDKSKNALSTRAWGNVDKGALRDKIMMASNYKSLVHDVYMVVESGWEDAPSQHLKYPVMEIVGGKLVYNKGGLSSALGYAKAENESGVVSKVNEIYNKLGLNEEESVKEEKKEKAEMEAPEKEEQPKAEEKQTEKMQEEPETPEEDKKETPKDEEDEGEKTSMSLDAFADIPAMLAALGEETEEAKELSAEFAKGDSKDFAKVAVAMYGLLKKTTEKMAAQAKENDNMKEEMAALKKFKQDVEGKNFEGMVNQTLSEVKPFVSEEMYSQFAEKAKQFSAENVGEWEKEVKAIAFSAIKVRVSNGKEEDDINRMPLNGSPTKQKQYIW